MKRLPPAPAFVPASWSLRSRISLTGLVAAGVLATVLGLTFLAYLQPGIFLSFTDLGLCTPVPGISISGAPR